MIRKLVKKMKEILKEKYKCYKHSMNNKKE